MLSVLVCNPIFPQHLKSTSSDPGEKFKFVPKYDIVKCKGGPPICCHESYLFINWATNRVSGQRNGKEGDIREKKRK